MRLMKRKGGYSINICSKERRAFYTSATTSKAGCYLLLKGNIEYLKGRID